MIATTPSSAAARSTASRICSIILNVKALSFSGRFSRTVAIESSSSYSMFDASEFMSTPCLWTRSTLTHSESLSLNATTHCTGSPLALAVGFQTEEVLGLDRLGHNSGNHRFPGWVFSLDPFQNIRRVNRQQRFVVSVNGHEASDLQQQVTQVFPRCWNRCLHDRTDLVGSGVASRIDVHLHRTFEQASGGFKHSTWQVREIPLVRHQLWNRRQPNREPDEAIGVGGQVLGQLVVWPEPRDQNVETKSLEDFRPGQKILVTEALALAQAPQCHLGQHYGLLSGNARFLQKLIERRGEEVERELRRGPEAASLDEDWFLVKDLRRLHDLAVRREHGGVGQSALHQLEAKQAIVHTREGWSGELDHVDLDPFARQVVHQ